MMALLSKMKKSLGIQTSDILDVGCGLGYFSSEVSQSGYSVVAVEGDSERAGKAKERGLDCLTRMVNTAADLDILDRSYICVSLRNQKNSTLIDGRCMW
jgi:2-polyprenyl-3-methyl-5-hydroxy-6-metoxy-1,4-benzoquinol methylase